MKISYKTSIEPMARAGLILLENKGLMRRLLPWMNWCTLAALCMYPIKAYTMGLTLTDYGFFFWLLSWYFGRRPLNLAILRWRLKSAMPADPLLQLHIDHLGIHSLHWDFPWKGMTHALHCADGYIFANGPGHFLWLPEQAIAADRAAFATYIKALPVPLQALPKKRCTAI